LFFTAGEHLSKVPPSFLLHGTVISLVSGILSFIGAFTTHQAISHGQKVVHVHRSEKHLMEQVV